ncbi:ribonuclease P protein component [Luteimonas pelagia]
MTDTVDERFPRSARVLARAEFDRVFSGGRRGATPLLAVHWLRGEVPPKLGLAVSRKVDPRAVGRNRIKRIVRDAFRRARAQLAPGSYVVVARAAAARAEAGVLREAFDSALRRLGALPPPDAAGTMPGSPNDPAAPPDARAGRSRLPPDPARR